MYVFAYKTCTASHNQHLLPCSSFRTDIGCLKVRLMCEILPSMYRDLLQLLQTQLTKFTESFLLLLVNRAHRQTDNLVTPAPVQIIHLPDSSPKLTSYFALGNPVSSFGVGTLLTYKQCIKFVTLSPLEMKMKKCFLLSLLTAQEIFQRRCQQRKYGMDVTEID